MAPDSIDLDVERNVLTVKAERTPTFDDGAEVQVTERPRGVFSRQLFLGDTLDADNIKADYDAGVLTLRVPIVEQAKCCWHRTATTAPLITSRAPQWPLIRPPP